jgi:NCS1 family nucleobase:cation symporter-1
MFYIWGFTSAFVSYSLLSHFFPEPATLIEETIPGEAAFEEVSASEEKADGSDGGDEKTAIKTAIKSVDYEV